MPSLSDLFPISTLPARMGQRLEERRHYQLLHRQLQALRPVPDLATHATRRGWPSQVIAGEEMVWRRPSLTLPSQFRDVILNHRRLFSKEEKLPRESDRYARLCGGEWYRVPPALLVEIPQATVHFASGAAFDQEGHVFPETSTFFPLFTRTPSTSPPLEDIPELPGRYLIIPSVWGYNYAHWLWDSLPRWAALRYCPDDTKILIYKDAPGYQRESLRLLGVPDERMVEAPGALFRVEHLMALCSGHNCGPHPYLARETRNALLAAVGADAKTAGTRRFYAGRNQAPVRARSTRRILNEPELLDLLERHGFETIQPQSLSFADQIRLFASASVVAGPHGAALYNILFAPEQSSVMEFLVWEHFETSVSRLSSLCEINHFHLFGQAQNAQLELILDIKKVERLLAMMLPEMDRRLAMEPEIKA